MQTPAPAPTAAASPRRAAATLRVLLDFPSSNASFAGQAATAASTTAPGCSAEDSTLFVPLEIPEISDGLGTPSTATAASMMTAAETDLRLSGEAPNSAKRYRDSATIKGPWTDEEDELLRKLVEKYSPSKWSLIASHMENRNGKQCRERWLNHLSEGIRKGTWSESEEELLVDAHQVRAPHLISSPPTLRGHRPRRCTAGSR